MTRRGLLEMLLGISVTPAAATGPVRRTYGGLDLAGTKDAAAIPIRFAARRRHFALTHYWSFSQPIRFAGEKERGQWL